MAWEPAKQIGALLQNGLAVGVTLAASAFSIVVITWSQGAKGGIAGAAGGLVLGVITAAGLILGVAAVFAWFVASARQAPPLRSSDPALVEPMRQLEAIRQDVVQVVTHRAAWSVPLCAALGVGLWAVMQHTDPDPPTVIELAVFMVLGMLAATAYAVPGQNARYRSAYKAKVLPVLAAKLGLEYRTVAASQLAVLGRRGLFPTHDHAEVREEFFGDYRGLAVEVAPLGLIQGKGKNARTVFEGVIVQVGLKNRLLGETVIIRDAGAIGNILESLRGQGGQRVALVDPEFERMYEVYSNDQVMARALLQPDFMERLKALARDERFGKAFAVASDANLTLVLPRPGARQLLKAPDFNHPGESEKKVESLLQDIRSLLSTADVAISLDAATARAAATA